MHDCVVQPPSIGMMALLIEAAALDKKI